MSGQIRWAGQAILKAFLFFGVCFGAAAICQGKEEIKGMTEKGISMEAGFNSSAKATYELGMTASKNCLQFAKDSQSSSLSVANRKHAFEMSVLYLLGSRDSFRSLDDQVDMKKDAVKFTDSFSAGAIKRSDELSGRYISMPVQIASLLSDLQGIGVVVDSNFQLAKSQKDHWQLNLVGMEKSKIVRERFSSEAVGEFESSMRQVAESLIARFQQDSQLNLAASEVVAPAGGDGQATSAPTRVAVQGVVETKSYRQLKVSVEGLVRKRNGAVLGVAGDSSFSMISRGYLKENARGHFLQDRR